MDRWKEKSKKFSNFPTYKILYLSKDNEYYYPVNNKTNAIKSLINI